MVKRTTKRSNMPFGSIYIENIKSPVRGLRSTCWGGAVTVLDAKTLKVKRIISERQAARIDRMLRAGLTK